MEEIPIFSEVCELAARRAGAVLVEKQGHITVKEKGPADLVTEADYAAQEIIQEILLSAFPKHSFLGEEDTLASATIQDDGAEFRWVVDPLDGTTNYVHGLEHYCVSIGLLRNNKPCLGIVYDPVRDELFRATTGNGAFLNNRPIASSNVRQLKQALVAASLSPRVKAGSSEVTRFLNVLYRSQSVRRLGSAALNLCYVATGRLDAYWGTSVNIWDVAAGLLIMHEAGGESADLSGKPVDLFRPMFAAAANTELRDEMLMVLRNDGPCS